MLKQVRDDKSMHCDTCKASVTMEDTNPNTLEVSLVLIGW